VTSARTRRLKAVIATDGSEPAIRAARRAVRLFAPETDVLLLAVADAPPLPTVSPQSLMGGSVANPDAIEQVRNAGRSEAEHALRATNEALQPEIDELRLRVDPRLADGDPARIICEVAEQVGADVVVVGSRGLGFAKRAVLGSVSTHVVRNASCPVLVVRDED
jgi:nucleotide-binding universal stress UspA family protein